MKKGMLLFAFVGLFAIGAQAQSCCSKAKAGADQTAVDQETKEAAMAAASIDESVQARTSTTTGQVSFVRSVVNRESGHTTFQEVEYCTKSGKFVNATAEEKKACTKEAKSACCAKGAKAGCSSTKGASTEAAAPSSATAGEKKGGA